MTDDTEDDLGWGGRLLRDARVLREASLAALGAINAGHVDRAAEILRKAIDDTPDTEASGRD